MDTDTFWNIVHEMKWPEIHYDEARLRFMQNHRREEAEKFLELFLTHKVKLNKAAGEAYCCDSWDDTTAHIIGLGKEEFDRHIENPRLIFEREKKMDYRESFAYCIPHPHDYEKLTDDGFEDFIEETRNELREVESADEDDIPPKLFRQFPKVMEVCRLLIDKNWRKACDSYHHHFGPGYADSWPLKSFLVPNFVKELELYRLR